MTVDCRVGLRVKTCVCHTKPDPRQIGIDDRPVLPQHPCLPGEPLFQWGQLGGEDLAGLVADGRGLIRLRRDHLRQDEAGHQRMEIGGDPEQIGQGLQSLRSIPNRQQGCGGVALGQIGQNGAVLHDHAMRRFQRRDFASWIDRQIGRRAMLASHEGNQTCLKWFADFFQRRQRHAGAGLRSEVDGRNSSHAGAPRVSGAERRPTIIATIAATANAAA